MVYSHFNNIISIYTYIHSYKPIQHDDIRQNATKVFYLLVSKGTSLA